MTNYINVPQSKLQERIRQFQQEFSLDPAVEIRNYHVPTHGKNSGPSILNPYTCVNHKGLLHAFRALYSENLRQRHSPQGRAFAMDRVDQQRQVLSILGEEMPSSSQMDEVREVIAGKEPHYSLKTGEKPGPGKDRAETYQHSQRKDLYTFPSVRVTSNFKFSTKAMDKSGISHACLDLVSGSQNRLVSKGEYVISCLGGTVSLLYDEDRTGDVQEGQQEIQVVGDSTLGNHKGDPDKINIHQWEGTIPELTNFFWVVENAIKGAEPFEGKKDIHAPSRILDGGLEILCYTTDEKGRPRDVVGLIKHRNNTVVYSGKQLLTSFDILHPSEE